MQVRSLLHTLHSSMWPGIHRPNNLKSLAGTNPIASAPLEYAQRLRDELMSQNVYGLQVTALTSHTAFFDLPYSLPKPAISLEQSICLREPLEQLNARATERSIDFPLVNFWRGSLRRCVFLVFSLLPSRFALIPWRDVFRGRFYRTFFTRRFYKTFLEDAFTGRFYRTFLQDAFTARFYRTLLEDVFTGRF